VKHSNAVVISAGAASVKLYFRHFIVSSYCCCNRRPLDYLGGQAGENHG